MRLRVILSLLIASIGLGTPTQLESATAAAAGAHTVIVTPSGTVWTWGSNGSGELGDGTKTARLTPVLVTGIGDVIAIAAGDSHTLALRSDGTVWAWGGNGAGQLGDGTPWSSTVPKLVVGPTNIVAIAAGRGHSVALAADGTVWTWGGNWSGQIGNGSTSIAYVPVPVSTGWSAIAIAAGDSHTLAVRADGTVWGWGANGSGQLGDGSSAQALLPVQATGVVNAVALAAGICHSVVLRDDETVATSGCSGDGQLGDGSTITRRTFSTVPAVSGVAEMSSGEHFTLARTHGGEVWAWGDNNVGQLGDSTTTDRFTPVRATILSGIQSIGAGGAHAVAVSTTGVVWTWGSNYGGQLGDGTDEWGAHSTPRPISDTDYRWKVGTPRFSLAGGNYQTDQVVTITDATEGAEIHYTLNGSEPTLGDPVIASGGSLTIDRSLTLKARAWHGTSPPSSIAGATYTMKVAFIGLVPYGGTFSTPQTVTVSTTTPGVTLRYTIDGSTPSELSPVYAAPLAIGTSTSLKVIGFRSGWTPSPQAAANYVMNFGTLAAPAISPAGGTYITSAVVVLESAPGAAIRYTTDGSTPWQFSPVYTAPLSVTTTQTVKAIASHPDYTTSAVASATYTIDVATPILLPPGGTYPAGQTITVTDDTPGATIRYTLDGRDPTTNDPSVASGGTFTAGNYTLKVRAWKPGATTSPVVAGTYRITGSVAVAHLDGGEGRSLAVRSDGIAWAWGATAGNGSRFESPFPWQVASYTGVKSVSAGGHYMVALFDGSVVAWGWNESGQIGDGSTNPYFFPIRLTSIGGIAVVSAGQDHSVALKADGTVWTWGSNALGQIGDGSTTNRLSPGMVSGLTGITAISAGWNSVLALKSDGRIYAWGDNQRGQLGDGSTTQRKQPVRLSLRNVVAIFAGGEHAFARDSRGVWWAWGHNQFGQLGNGSTDPLDAPEAVSFPTTMATIAPGGLHTLGLASNGTVWAWGINSTGQLGMPGLDRHTPTQVPGLSGIVGVAAGDGQSFALAADGTIWAWGRNGSGEVGDGTKVQASAPVIIAGPGMAWKVLPPTINTPSTVYYSEVAATVTSNDPAATLHYTLDGRVPTEGDPVVTSGQAVTITRSATLTVNAWKSGAPPSEPVSKTYELKVLTPVLSPATGRYLAAVAVTISSATPGTTVTYTRDGTEPSTESSAYSGPIAIDRTSTVKAGAYKEGWTASDTGYASYSMVAGTVARPNLVPPPGSYAAPQLLTFTCETENATIRYTLDGSDPDVTSPVYRHPVFLSSNTVVRAQAYRADFTPSGIEVGSYTFAGSVGTPAPTLSPRGGRFATRQFITVQAAPDATIRYTLNGQDPDEDDPLVPGDRIIVVGKSISLKVRAWRTGENPSAVGRGDYLITGAVAAGEYHTLALTTEGSVWAWGENRDGQLGLGDNAGQYRLSPAQVLISDVVAVSGGPSHSLALKHDGTVWAWGNNYCGALGDGGTSSRNTPAPVPGLSNVVAIAAGGSKPFFHYGHSLALTADGSVWAWGCNNYGQLGDGSTTPRVLPVRVVMLEGITAISARGMSSIAIQGDGASGGLVWGWGGSESGSHPFPSRLANVPDARRIAGGFSDGVALRADGSMWEWGGLGLQGQTIRDPVAVPILNRVFEIADGAQESLALSHDGVRWAWGSNQWGGLGNGSTSSCHSISCLLSGQVRPSPPVLAAATGNGHSVWLHADGTVTAAGRNDWGQLGNGVYSTSSTPDPVAVPGLLLADNAWLLTDEDDDGLAAWRELVVGTDPYSADTNGNGLFDGLEEDSGGSGVHPDTDGDGVANWVEIATGTDPYAADTDHDGVSDGADAYPLDPARSALPQPTLGDVTPPTITLTEPLTARPIPPDDL